MKKLFALLAIAATAINSFAVDRLELMEKIRNRGVELTNTIQDLEQTPEKHPDSFKFRGTLAQRKAAYAAQESKHGAWVLKYKPAIQERETLKKAYQELVVCQQSRVADIAVELSGVMDLEVTEVDTLVGDWVHPKQTFRFVTSRTCQSVISGRVKKSFTYHRVGDKVFLNGSTNPEFTIKGNTLETNWGRTFTRRNSPVVSLNR